MTELLFDPTQPDVLPAWRVPAVRRGGPETSVEAARTAAGKADTLRRLVYEELREHGPMTHDDLWARLSDWSPSGVRSRCAELVRAGLVEHVGFAVNAAGNRTRVWGAR